MKHISGAKTLTIAAVAVLALNIAPAANADNKGCSAASVKGTFSRKDSGIVVAPAAIAGPTAAIGTFTFDGVGGVAGATISSQNGAIVQQTQAGTYTVNSDCTGTITVAVTPGGFSAHYSFVMDNSLSEFQYICTDPLVAPISIVYAGTATRQFPVGDWRQ